MNANINQLTFELDKNKYMNEYINKPCTMY